MAQPKKARLGFPFLGVILAFCLVGVLAVILRPGDRPSPYEEKRKRERLDRLSVLRKEEAKVLNHYGWANKEKGIVHIPIQQAMALTVDALKQKGVSASDVKAEAISTSLIPPYLQGQQPEAAPEAAPAGETTAPEAAPEAAAQASPAPEAAQTTPQAEAPAAPPAETVPAAETAN